MHNGIARSGGLGTTGSCGRTLLVCEARAAALSSTKAKRKGKGGLDPELGCRTWDVNPSLHPECPREGNRSSQLVPKTARDQKIRPPDAFVGPNLAAQPLQK